VLSQEPKSPGLQAVLQQEIRSSGVETGDQELRIFKASSTRDGVQELRVLLVS
jgi:hypothetical protein